jgi:hypothetical protein
MRPADILSNEQINAVSDREPAKKLRAWMYHEMLTGERLSCVYRNKLRTPAEMEELCIAWLDAGIRRNSFLR